VTTPDGADSRLLKLGLGGVVLGMVVTLTLFIVQSHLSETQDRLAHRALAIHQALGDVTSSIGGMAQRQAQLSSAETVAQLREVRDRAVIRSDLRGDLARLAELLPPLGPRGQATANPDPLPATVDEYLALDRELFESLARRHAIAAEFQRQREKVDGGLRQLVEDGMAVEGQVRLAYVTLLRRAAAGQQTSLREIALNYGRTHLEDVSDLVSALASFGWRTGKIEVARTADELNSIFANEITQNRTAVAGLLDNLAERGSHAAGAERLQTLRARFLEIAGTVADESNPQSLVSLRRQNLAEAKKASANRRRSLDAAAVLGQSLATLHKRANDLSRPSQETAAATILWSRLLSLTICLLTLGICFGAARRIVRRLRGTSDPSASG
jgi:hypothetical protein